MAHNWILQSRHRSDSSALHFVCTNCKSGVWMPSKPRRDLKVASWNKDDPGSRTCDEVITAKVMES